MVASTFLCHDLGVYFQDLHASETWAGAKKWWTTNREVELVAYATRPDRVRLEYTLRPLRNSNHKGYTGSLELMSSSLELVASRVA